MRLDIFKKAIYAAAVILLMSSLAASRLFAQNADSMMPEQSAAKAKQLLQQLITTLGGPAYLGVRETQCDGRRAQFDRLGKESGFVEFHDYWKYPDHNRLDMEIRNERGLSMILGDIIPEKTSKASQLYVGDKGWFLDRSGVQEQPEDHLAEFQRYTRGLAGNILRFHLSDDALTFRYAGTDIADAKEVEWVEITSSDDFTIRLAIEHSTHLLARTVVISTDQETQQRNEDVTIYTNYQWKQGVLTPMQTGRERNGHRLSQTFLEDCKYNPVLPADFFTRVALEKRASQLGIKPNQQKDNH